MRAHQVQILLEDGESRVVLLFREVVPVVLRHEGLEGFDVIGGKAGLLEKARGGGATCG